jgi:hypothetical protein
LLWGSLQPRAIRETGLFGCHRFGLIDLKSLGYDGLANDREARGIPTICGANALADADSESGDDTTESAAKLLRRSHQENWKKT